MEIVDLAVDKENEDTAALLNKSPTNKRWTNTQIILMSIIIAICVGVFSNIDRIISSLESSSDPSSSSFGSYNVVIIGMGASGLTSTEYLSSSDPNLDILMIDKLERVGGRTFSVHLNYNSKSIVFENGAMRFGYQPLMFKMLYYLDLCDDFILLKQSNNDKGSYLYRNQYSEISNINGTNYWQNIYHFNEKEWEWFVEQTNTVQIGYNQILNENNNGNEPQNDDEWYSFRNNWTLNGVLLRDWSLFAFRKLILNESNEYYNYRKEKTSGTVGPTGSDKGNLAWILYNRYAPKNYTTTNNRWTLKNGYNTITWKLYDKIMETNNVESMFKTELIGIDCNTNTNNDRFKYKLNLKINGSVFESVFAEKVILTIPQTYLRDLLPDLTPINNEYVSYLLNSAYNYFDYKINLIYDSSFWIDSNLSDLCCNYVTDIGIGQFIIDDAWSNGTLTCIQIYTESGSWHYFQSLGDAYPIDDGIEIENFSEDLIISSQFLVNEAIRQLTELTQISFPLPLAAFSQPFGQNGSNMASDDMWKYGYSVDDVLENIFHPIKDEEIYIASSSYSIYHSWQYGAFWAAIQNLIRNFDVSDPLMDAPECDIPL